MARCRSWPGEQKTGFASSGLMGLERHFLAVPALALLLGGCGGGSELPISGREFPMQAMAAASTAETPVEAIPRPIPITGYDIKRTPESGLFGFEHVYTGTKTPTGRSILAGTYRLLDYAGGSGTLNDGIYPFSVTAAHMLKIGTADDGLPVAPLITMYLGRKVLITSLKAYQGPLPSGPDFYAGAFISATFEIGTTSETIPLGRGFGPTNSLGWFVNREFMLANTSLGTIPTDRIVLRDFLALMHRYTLREFEIGEIEIEGIPLIDVNIDIRPGNPHNKVNLASNGKLPVALLSSPDFDAPKMVQPATLRFGKTGEEISLSACPTAVDLNHDKLPDLLCMFNTAATGLSANDDKAILKGITRTGEILRSQASIQTKDQNILDKQK
ncbi:hypothetical protein [Azohydromonas caseinilytica]|uniref:Uncharacterized protein n=1 Tax=Azohydromonas caseinilytica TaxID=2728836 RepID=A0A848FKQ8_9BURK|nr:hypothetical protein [Azohydromonas caseinilytica]NML18381.1 hypothetical protein [Azohydromonas caseinilytica]